jgi:acetyl esterase
MRIILTALACIIYFASRPQSCDVGKLDPRVEENLLKIGDLKPKLNRISIEQAKQDKLDHEQLYPDNDVTRVKITSDSIPIYVFHATHDENIPVILYFHPGGFVTPFLTFMKYECWKMSKDLHAIVFAVDYRIAPAYKFPAPVNDAYKAFEWLLTHGKMYGGDIDKLVVAGMSAGANLAAVVSHKARDNGLASKIKLQILNCPSVDNINHQSKYPSYEKYATGYFQTKEFIIFAQRTYCDEEYFSNPEFAPILAKDFHGLPPVVMFATEFDVLKDEEMAYVAKLRDAGVKVWHHCFAGQIHCLVGLPPESKEFETLNDIIRAAMAEVF